MIKTPTCIRCGEPPALALPVQWFCDNEDCDVFCWNPTMTVEENEAEVNLIDLGGLP